MLENLIAARDKAQLQLDIAKSQLITAKEQRAHAEYQRYLEETKRAIALQQQQIELERQRSIRAGQLQEREYSKAQIETKIQEIDNAIAQLQLLKPLTLAKLKRLSGRDKIITILLLLLPWMWTTAVKSEPIQIQNSKVQNEQISIQNPKSKAVSTPNPKSQNPKSRSPKSLALFR